MPLAFALGEISTTLFDGTFAGGCSDPRTGPFPGFFIDDVSDRHVEDCSRTDGLRATSMGTASLLADTGSIDLRKAGLANR